MKAEGKKVETQPQGLKEKKTEREREKEGENHPPFWKADFPTFVAIGSRWKGH